MENVQIILDNGVETSVSGLFYIFNSKYYFIYTLGELDENEYIKLYIVQVCKEVKNTPTGPVDTGHMLGLEISDLEEWKKVQESITKIVDDKKNDAKNTEIQYLPINMIINLKIVSKNKFKLMKHIIENNFKVMLSSISIENTIDNTSVNLNNNTQNDINFQIIQPAESIQQDELIQSVEPMQLNPPIDNSINVQDSQSIDTISNVDNVNEVIIDYRSRFFEEQEKNKELEEQIKNLNEKLEGIKNIIG